MCAPRWRIDIMAVGERCPACGHMPGDEVGAGLSAEGQITAWAVELTRASTQPGEDPALVGTRLRTIRGALATLDDGPGIPDVTQTAA
jgi:hypothetical protein